MTSQQATRRRRQQQAQALAASAMCVRNFLGSWGHDRAVQRRMQQVADRLDQRASVLHARQAQATAQGERDGG